MGKRTVLHQPWCAEDCAAATTDVQLSQPVPGTEPIGISVHLERLAAPAPFDVVAIEFTMDGEETTLLMPPRQARVLRRVLDRPPAIA